MRNLKKNFNPELSVIKENKKIRLFLAVMDNVYQSRDLATVGKLFENRFAI